MNNIFKINLDKSMFSEKEKIILENKNFTVSSFLFSTGVEALRVKNKKGELVILPFAGQQIWRANFLGRELTMESMFSEPNNTQNYLQTYGGFLLHCGATAIGGPSEEDTHPLHGELPNAKYQKAWINICENKNETYLEICGSYEFAEAFKCHYIAMPKIILKENDSIFKVSMRIKNLSKTQMELMYMAHVNFKPVDNSSLVYSAKCNPENVRVRTSIPSHINPPKGYREFLNKLKVNPKLQNKLDPKLPFNPEAVFSIDFLADKDDWAHNMQIHPDSNSADYIAHKPKQLPKGIRCISRMPDQDNLGMCLPATAEVEGYLAEKKKGNILKIKPKKEFFCELKIGAIEKKEIQNIKQKINKILKKK